MIKILNRGEAIRLALLVTMFALITMLIPKETSATHCVGLSDVDLSSCIATEVEVHAAQGGGGPGTGGGAGGGRGFVSPPSAQPCDTGLPPDEYTACIAAASGGGSGSGGSGGSGSGGSGGSGSGSSINIVNPLQSTTILEFLGKIIDVLLIFALPIIVFFIIYAGFKFVTARGNESEITTAKTALTWAVVGGVIILGAKLIITVIQGTISVL